VNPEFPLQDHRNDNINFIPIFIKGLEAVKELDKIISTAENEKDDLVSKAIKEHEE